MNSIYNQLKEIEEELGHSGQVTTFAELAKRADQELEVIGRTGQSLLGTVQVPTFAALAKQAEKELEGRRTI